MTLPEGWTVEEEAPQEKAPLPTGWSIEEEPKPHKYADDVVSKNLREQGYEPDFSEEMERVSEFGMRNATKAFGSGATFGISENVDALKPEEAEGVDAFKVIGSFLPLSKMLSISQGGATALAAKSPVLQRTLGAVYSLLGVGVVGGTTKGIETLAKGEIPTADELLEHGTEWMVLDGLLNATGFLGKFAWNLLKKSRATGINRKELVNTVIDGLGQAGVDMSAPEKVTEAAFEILEGVKAPEGQAVKKLEPFVPEVEKATTAFQEALPKSEEVITAKDLKGKKISDKTAKKMEIEAPVLAEPIQPEPRDYSAQIKKLEDSGMFNVQLEVVSPRAASEEALGTAIKEDVEKTISKRKAEYTPLYKEAEQAAQEILHVPQNTAREAGNKLIELAELETKPAGYSSVIKNLETALEDAGYTIQKAEDGTIELIVSSEEVPVSRTIKLAKRLNEIIDYEAVEPTVKNALKSVKSAAKEDIRLGLDAKPDARAAFDLAEDAHARTASRYTRDSIRKVRETQAGEKVTSMLDSPTTLKDLKEITTPEQFAQIEREVLERLNSKSYEAAKKQLREVEDSLTAKTKKLAKEIVEAKNPANPAARRNAIKNNIVEDVSEAFTTGQRPKKTLDLWQTKKGQRLVEDAFEGSPNWKEVKNYLENQSFNDMVASVTKPNGMIDVNKMKQFMKDPVFVENIRSQGGEEAVQFFKSLDENIHKVRENFNLLSKVPTSYEIGRGQQLLRKTAEKAKEAGRVKQTTKEIGKDVLSPKKGFEKAEQAKATEAKIERGNKILERMKRKDYPIQAKKQDWENWIKDQLGLNAQSAMTVFGLAKLGIGAASGMAFGIPSTVTAMISYRVMNKMLTSPRTRKAFLDASKHKINPISFILAFEEFGDTID